MKIFKYKIDENADYTLINMHEGSTILSFQSQNDQFFIWALIDQEKPTKERKFQLVMTGQECHFYPVSDCYLGTAQIHDQAFVAHLFEIL